MLKKIVFIVLLVLAIVFTVMLFVQNEQILIDIDKQLERCALEAYPETMSDCLDTVVDNMDTYGATTGYSGLIPNPANDVAQDYEALQGLRDRAWTIAQEPIENQAVLLDVRTAVSEIDVNAMGWAMLNLHLWLFLLSVVLIVASVVAGFFLI